MLFYRAINTDGCLKLAPTQAEAKKINKDYDSIDVPTDKPGLMEVLQDLLDRANTSSPDNDEPDELDASEETIRSKSNAPPAEAISPTVNILIDFVLNTATTEQTENIFAALGCRLKEISQELAAINAVQADEPAPF